MSPYAMTDKALAQEIGQRIEQLRLEKNIPQKAIAAELGITDKTYRNLVAGNGKLETLLGVMRVLDCLNLVDGFIPKAAFSPMEMVRLRGRKRQRASRGQEEAAPDDDLGW